MFDTGMDSVVATVRESESKTQLVDRVLAELEAVAPHDITSSGVGDLVDVFLKWLKSSQIKVIMHTHPGHTISTLYVSFIRT